MDSINLEIFYLDGSKKTVEVLASDIVAYELRFEKSIDEIGLMTHFYFLGWHAVSRAKETSKTFEEWIENVRKVEPSDPKGLSA